MVYVQESFGNRTTRNSIGTLHNGTQGILFRWLRLKPCLGSCADFTLDRRLFCRRQTGAVTSTFIILEMKMKKRVVAPRYCALAENMFNVVAVAVSRVSIMFVRL